MYAVPFSVMGVFVYKHCTEEVVYLRLILPSILSENAEGLRDQVIQRSLHTFHFFGISLIYSLFPLFQLFTHHILTYLFVSYFFIVCFMIDKEVLHNSICITWLVFFPCRLQLEEKNQVNTARYQEMENVKHQVLTPDKPGCCCKLGRQPLHDFCHSAVTRNSEDNQMFRCHPGVITQFITGICKMAVCVCQGSAKYFCSLNIQRPWTTRNATQTDNQRRDHRGEDQDLGTNTTAPSVKW